jgi:hypothetical protein
MAENSKALQLEIFAKLTGQVTSALIPMRLSIHDGLMVLSIGMEQTDRAAPAASDLMDEIRHNLRAQGLHPEEGQWHLPGPELTRRLDRLELRLDLRKK